MFANIGPWQLLIILVIVLAIFGTKKLRSLGSDLGKSVKGFRSAMSEAEETADQISDESKQMPTSTTRRSTKSQRKRRLKPRADHVRYRRLRIYSLVPDRAPDSGA